MFYQILRAGHDKNGNPRKLGVACRVDGNGVATIHEVSDIGFGSVPTEWKKTLVEMPQLDITVKQYNDLCAQYGAN